MDLLPHLERHFGYPGFRPGQESLVRAALDGRDALGILPTGGGKSVCYMLPAALLPGLTVVVSPLVSLMADQVERAAAAGIPAALLNSTLDAGARRQVLDRLRAGVLKLLLVAPERFRVPAFRRVVDAARVSLLAVDEAHCIAAWGHDFRPAYRRLGEVRRALGVPCLALTATATPRVRGEIEEALGLRAPVRVVGSFDRPNLFWEVARVGRREERDRLARRAVTEVLDRGEGAVVVYAGTRRAVEGLRRRWAGLGYRVEAYHGGMRGDERARVQDAFMEGALPLVVATNAFGMGVDKPDVRLVLHWQLPGSLEGYYQEAGRAGRDGEAARCVALHGPGDGVLHRRFLDRSRPPVRALRRLVRELAKGAPEPGSPVQVTPAVVARRMGRGWSPEGVVAALRLLEGAGVVRVAGEDAASDAPETLRLSVRPGRPPLERLRALRRAGEARLGAVEAYATTPACRRRALLAYFGESLPGNACGACDRCVEPGVPDFEPHRPVGSLRGLLRPLTRVIRRAPG